jgi:hypothetical protein
MRGWRLLRIIIRKSAHTLPVTLFGSPGINFRPLGITSGFDLKVTLLILGSEVFFDGNFNFFQQTTIPHKNHDCG